VKIKGYFHWDGSACLDVMVELPETRVRRAVSFVVDTGVLRTIISERDALKLGVEFESIARMEEGMLGIGGFADTYYVEDAILSFFSEEHRRYEERLDRIFISRQADLPDEIKNQIPSLLGRDVINKMALVVDKRRELVALTDEALDI
jgi:hypothetical protein